MTIPKEDIQGQLLAVLVMDLGYDAAPIYGHSPLRHQFGWDCATDGMAPDDVARHVAAMRAQQQKEAPQLKAQEARQK